MSKPHPCHTLAKVGPLARWSCRRCVAIFGAWVLLTPGEAAAADPRPPREIELRHDLTTDLAITSGGLALAISLELLLPTIGPTQCRWCDRDSQGNDRLNGFDAAARDALRWSNPWAARRASNVFSYVLAPLAGVGIGALVATHDKRSEHWLVDLTIIAQATMLSINFNQLSKLAVARERPDVHARSAEERARSASPDDNLSFYSGHTSVAFALATSAGTVASMRQYRFAPILWVSGLSLAAASGYLRIAADRHYATDVLAGALFGSLIGFSVPYFLHSVKGSYVAASPSLGASSLVFAGTW